MKVNNIQCGDCLNIMKTIPSNSIDLIYLDPPYFSNRDYHDVWKNTDIITSFDDTCWFTIKCKCGHIFNDITGIEYCPQCGKFIDPVKCNKIPNMSNYINWLYSRLEQCYKLLKTTGTIYVHLDHHVVHYIKVEMDKLFGTNNFRNEIVWKYSGGGIPKRDFPRKHDTILRYTKSNEWIFNIEYKSYTESTLASGVHYDGSPLRKEGTPITDWWDDIQPVSGWSKERIGYPTQKPISLLERIIKTSSNPGDIVMDPFMGGGTTLIAARNCGRKYIGIDKSPSALRLVQSRVNIDPKTIEFGPKSVADLKAMSHFDFEEWAVIMLNGITTSKTGDRGIDGYINKEIAIQVKKSDNIGSPQITAFLGAIQRNNYKSGIFVTLGFTGDIQKTITEIRRNTGIEIQLYTADQLLGRNNDGYIKNCKYTKTLDNWI